MPSETVTAADITGGQRVCDSGRILLADSDELHLVSLELTLSLKGFKVTSTTQPTSTFELLARETTDVVVLDLSMTGIDGLELLARLHAAVPDVAVVVLSSHVDIPTTVLAMRSGAADVLAKPVDTPSLLQVLERAVTRVRRLRRERCSATLAAETTALLDHSPATERLRGVLEQVALGCYPLLLRGEPGTVKDAAARYIHDQSLRAHGQFVQGSCREMTATRDERKRHGMLVTPDVQLVELFDRAHGGTLFLQEITLLSFSLQATLARLMKRHCAKSGTEQSGAPNGVRVIMSTSWALHEPSVARGVLAEILTPQGVVPVTIPALRSAGPEAIVTLAASLLNLHRVRHGTGPVGISAEVTAMIGSAPWPGNVHQLWEMLRRGAAEARDEDPLDVAHLPIEFLMDSTARQAGSAEGDDSRTLEEVERRHIERVLLESGGNRSMAAKSLGISRGTLYNKLAVYGLDAVTAP